MAERISLSPRPSSTLTETSMQGGCFSPPFFFQFGARKSAAHPCFDPTSLPIRFMLCLPPKAGPGHASGQVLSVRPDLIPPEAMLELARLQNSVPVGGTAVLFVCCCAAAKTPFVICDAPHTFAQKKSPHLTSPQQPTSYSKPQSNQQR